MLTIRRKKEVSRPTKNAHDEQDGGVWNPDFRPNLSYFSDSWYRTNQQVANNTQSSGFYHRSLRVHTGRSHNLFKTHEYSEDRSYLDSTCSCADSVGKL